MGERLEICQRQSGVDCRGCKVAVDVAMNVFSKPTSPVVESILEVTNERCPEGTKFLLHGDLKDLGLADQKVIQLRPVNGESSENRETIGAAAAGL